MVNGGHSRRVKCPSINNPVLCVLVASEGSLVDVSDPVYEYLILVFLLNLQILGDILLLPLMVSKGISAYIHVIERNELHFFWGVLERVFDPVELFLGSVRVI